MGSVSLSDSCSSVVVMMVFLLSNSFALSAASVAVLDGSVVLFSSRSVMMI